MLTLILIFIVFIAFTVFGMEWISKHFKKTKSVSKERSIDSKSTHAQPANDTELNRNKSSDSISSTSYGNDLRLQAEVAENTVEHALRQLQENRYFVFRDLIIPSSSQSMNLTQIDHVVVSGRGIFCIETKSNNGNIYGFSRNENWKQYLGNSGKPYLLNSPYRQNKHHTSSLEMLLKDKLRAPIHSYIAFPNAKKVVVDGKVEDMSPIGVITKIQRHYQNIYDSSEVEDIAKILAHAGSYRDQLRNRHIDEVKAFIDAKVTGTSNLS